MSEEDFIMECNKCHNLVKESEIEEHHIHPRFMDNRCGNGMKINLCHKCHIKFHLMIPGIFWNIMTDEQKTEAERQVIGWGKGWGGLK